MGRVADAAPQLFRGSAASQGGAPKVRTKVTQALPSGHGRFAGLAREGHVFLRRIFGRVFKRLICVRSDFTCRNSLDFALGHRLCGLSGAPSREALPPLRGRDQSRDPPATSEDTIAVGSVAVVLSLPMGGSETSRAGPGSAGSARRSRFRISLGRSGLRECAHILLAIGPHAREERTSTRPYVRAQMAGRGRADRANRTRFTGLLLSSPMGTEATPLPLGTGHKPWAKAPGAPGSDTTSMVPLVVGFQESTGFLLEGAGRLDRFPSDGLR